MTVSVVTNKNFHDGNGVTTAFDFTFKYFNSNEVKAKIGGVDTTAFTVVANSSGEGGTATFTSAPASGSGNVLIYRDIAYTQESRIPNENKIARGTLETVMDKAMMAIQQVKEITDRAVVRSLSSTSTADLTLPEPSANKALKWNSSGDGLENSTNDFDTIVTDATAQAVAAAASASAAATSATNAAASAMVAVASAAAAATSEMNAANSATSASSSATTATTQASNAATSATNAATSATNAANSATAAAASATTATTQASNASTSATNAASSATTATTQASNASTSATNAANSATAAAASAAAAAVSETNAAASAASLTYASITEALTGTATNRMINPDTLAAIWEKGADIASAGTIHIPNTGGGYFVVTGTTTITAIVDDITPHNGRLVRLRFAGALTFTHNGTSLILPGSANITTAAGDVATLVTEDGTNWRCISYNKASGVATVVASTTTPIVVLQDQKSSGTDGGTSTGGAWTTHILNTKVLDSGSICTLSSNQFTLPSGTYAVSGFMTFENGNQCQCRIRNITDSTSDVIGNQGNSPTTTANTVGVAGGFTIAASKTFEFQYWSTAGAATTGLGRSNASGTQVYASLVIMKVA